MHARSRPPGRTWPARTVLLTAFIAFPWLSGCGGSGNQTPSNVPPQATGFCGTTPQELSLPGTLPATDPDNTPGGLLFSLNADGSGGAGPINTPKGQVVITDQLTGAFAYTPNAQPSPRGTDTFQYHVEDTAGGVAVGTATVIIDPKIMPLGDSITQGITATPFQPPLSNRVGYRQPLWDQLRASGFHVDFVGSRVIGDAVQSTDPTFDPDNNGYAGATEADILNGGNDGETGNAFSGIYNLLTVHPADIILLHIGTNDLTVSSPDTTATGVQQILAEINNWEETNANGNPVAVILARIIDQCANPGTNCGGGDPDVTTYNNNLDGIFSTVSAMNPSMRPDEMQEVDQWSALLIPNTTEPDPALYGNTLHPNDAGYLKMTTVWFNALTDPAKRPSIMAKCP